MSTFACSVERVSIEAHPNADRIELARVGEFRSIVQKGQFKDGDLAVYIPESAVVPEWMLKQMGLWDEVKGKGKLSGSAGNRVKAIKLRGVLSQGLIWPCGISIPIDADLRPTGEPNGWFVTDENDSSGRQVHEGDDVADILGVKKYEPPLPTHMRGRVVGADYDACFGYDFDNIKKMPSLFEPTDHVVVTEKVHGTFLLVGVLPTTMGKEKYYKGRVILSSKGLAKQGYILDPNDETNLYVQAARKHNLFDGMLDTYGALADERGVPIWIMGEVFGVSADSNGNLKNIQDLTYAGDVLQYRMFDAAWGPRSDPKFFDWTNMVMLAKHLRVKTVPCLYEGKFDRAVIDKMTNGTETISGANAHMREGVVVKTFFDERNPRYGRKIAKSISEAYLLRNNKDATEFN